jgi:hypothetical protein
VVEEVVEALLQAVEDQVQGAHPELDQFAEEPNVLDHRPKASLSTVSTRGLADHHRGREREREATNLELGLDHHLVLLPHEIIEFLLQLARVTKTCGGQALIQRNKKSKKKKVG